MLVGLTFNGKPMVGNLVEENATSYIFDYVYYNDKKSKGQKIGVPKDTAGPILTLVQHD